MINFTSIRSNVMGLLAALLIGTTFLAAATGPALVTGTTDSVIVA